MNKNKENQTHPQVYEIKETEPLILGDLSLYPDAYEAYSHGQKMPLRRKEYQLLEFLLRNKNRVLNRHTILEYIWDYDTRAITNTLDVHISSLRRKIERYDQKKTIKTVHGSGYKICDL